MGNWEWGIGNGEWGIGNGGLRNWELGNWFILGRQRGVFRCCR
ncbi:MAG: hypothetical protein QQW96_23875 [Tychonema bourrellyi B0820]|nr:hypothetical protein [Tychonema bourrellyi B0820]